MVHKNALLPNVSIERTRHGRVVFYYRRGKSARIRLPDDIRSPEFLEAYRVASGTSLSVAVVLSKHDHRKQAVERTLRVSFRAARRRATIKRVPFDLTLNFLLDRAEAIDFRCELTGIAFYLEASRPETSRVNPYMPSIDRIVPSRGYTKDNVRLVIFAVNAMILDWGEDLFYRVINSYRNQRTKRQPEPAPVEGARPSPPLTDPMKTNGYDSIAG